MVDMDQSGRWNAMSRTRYPSAGTAVAESSAQGKQHVAASRCTVSGIDAVADGRAQAQGVLLVHRSLALRRGRDRHVQKLGQLGQERPRVGQRAAMAREDEWAGRRMQQI